MPNIPNIPLHVRPAPAAPAAAPRPVLYVHRAGITSMVLPSVAPDLPSPARFAVSGDRNLDGAPSVIRTFTGFSRPLLGVSPLTATGGVLSAMSVSTDAQGKQSVTATLTMDGTDADGNLSGGRMTVTDTGIAGLPGTGQSVDFYHSGHINYNYPPGRRALASAYKGNVFEGGIPSLTFDNADGKVVRYEARDFQGVVVASGPIVAGQGTLSLPQLTKRQCYTVWLKGQVAQGQFGYDLGCTYVIVAPPPPNNNLPRLPAITPPLPGNIYDSDVPTAGWVGTPTRIHIENAASPEAEIANITSLFDAQNALYVNGPDGTAADPDKPRQMWCNFVGFSNAPGEVEGVTRAVAALSQHGVLLYEGPNEPYNGGNPGAWFVPIAQAFYGGVKAGNPAAQVTGPCAVNLLPNLREILQAGYGQYMDVFGGHAYLHRPSDVAAAVALLVEFGQGDKPRWMTEFGFEMEAGGVVTPRRMAEGLIRFFLLWDKNGFPAEHRPYWFVSAGGGRDFDNCLLKSDGSFGPQATLMHQYTVELYGKHFASAYAFGSGGDLLWEGNRYDAPANGTQGQNGTQAGQSVSLFAPVGHRGLTLTLSVSGPAMPAALVCADAWGNETSLPVVGGRITLPASDMTGCYVRHATALTLTPQGDLGTDWATDPAANVITPTNRVQAQQVITAAGTDVAPYSDLWGSDPDWFALGGQFGARYNNRTPLPYEFVVDLGQPRPVRDLIVQGVQPYQGAGGIVSATVLTAPDAASVGAVAANAGYLVTGTRIDDGGGGNGSPGNDASGVLLPPGTPGAHGYVSQAGANAYVGVDAGVLFDLSSVTYTAVQYQGAALIGSIIQGSVDGQQWQDLYTITTNPSPDTQTVSLTGRFRAVRLWFPGRAQVAHLEVLAGVVQASVDYGSPAWTVQGHISQPPNTQELFSDQGTEACHCWDYWEGAWTHRLTLAAPTTAQFIWLRVERISRGGQGDDLAAYFGGLAGGNAFAMRKIFVS